MPYAFNLLPELGLLQPASYSGLDNKRQLRNTFWVKYTLGGSIMSAIVLLTPLMLASATATLDLPPAQYSHALQTHSGFELNLLNVQYRTGGCFSTFTANGTQTFGYDGRPNDADSDKDNSGDC